MSKKKNNGFFENAFENIAIKLTKFSGSSVAFSTALGLIIIWGITGPLFGYSETWQLIINTGTTIITFLMVFLIQRTQNKDSLAIQLKLNEIIASIEGASNRLVDVEDMTEKDLELLKKYYIKLSKLMSQEHDLKNSHSVEEAEKVHKYKISKINKKS